MAKILFVITAATHWTLADGHRQPAGFWAEEALGPYAVFKEAGYEIAAATPGATRPNWPTRCASRTSGSTTTLPSSTRAAGARWRTCPTTPNRASC